MTARMPAADRCRDCQRPAGWRSPAKTACVPSIRLRSLTRINGGIAAIPPAWAFPCSPPTSTADSRRANQCLFVIVVGKLDPYPFGAYSLRNGSTSATDMPRR